MAAASKTQLLWMALVATPLAVALVWYFSGVPSSTGTLGGPIEGLSPEELRKFSQCRKVFEETVSVADGLGPLYNAGSCASCHSSPSQGGEGANLEDSDLVWIAARAKDRSTSAEPLESVKHLLLRKDVNELKELGGPFLYRKSVTDSSGDHTKSMAANPLEPDCKLAAAAAIPNCELVSKRHAPPLYGIGLLSAVMDDDLDDHEDDETEVDPTMSGRSVDIRDPLTGKLRVGRLGLKAQQPTLVNMTSFMMNAGLGVSTPLYPERYAVEELPRCLLAHLPAEPNDMGARAARLIYYLSVLAPPPRGEITPAVKRGEQQFAKLQCVFCHTPGMQTAPKVRVIDPDSPAPKFNYYPVEALSDKTFYPYTDLLLHYMGPALADGVPEGKASGGEWRTPPLWGLRFRKHLLHDGRATTIEDAIAAHDGQASEVIREYKGLPPEDRADLLAFLKSL